MEPWYTSDLSIRYQFKVQSSKSKAQSSKSKAQSSKFKAQSIKFIVQAEVNNVFDQDYEVIVNYPMPGRNYAITLSVEI